MKNAILSLLLIVTANLFTKAQTPASYPTAIVAAGSNSNITPLSAPVNVMSATAFTSPGFHGILQVNPATGVITVTNANPAGSYLVTVKVFNPVSSATSSFLLTVTNTGCSQGLFSGTATMSVGNLPYAGAVGDFNNDNKQDIVTANYGYNTVSIRLGDGLGNLNGNINMTVGLNPQSVAIGDFNGDGNQDIAVANFVSYNVSILFGNGTGGFSPAINLPVGDLPFEVVTGDFNGDGKADIATANYGGNTVSILTGNGSGIFNPPVNISVGNGPRSIIIADFNLDGKQDFATANYLDNSISVRLGNGIGGFTAGTSYAVGTDPHSITSADFNADGKPDLAIANFGGASVSVRFGSGTGTFSGNTEINVGPNPRSVTSGDFNGDGKQDIATANYSSHSVAIRLGDGTGGFSGNTSVPVGNSPFCVLTGDFNADARQDIATTNAGSNDISIRLSSLNSIDVLGNNNLIADGTNTASLSDHTDFGNVTSSLTRQYIIKNTSTVNLTVKNIIPGGMDATLFTIGGISLPATITPGAMVGFTATFIPTSTGIKSARINIANDNCDKGNYDFAIQGTGVALVPELGIYQNTTVPHAGGNIIITPSAAPANTQNITAYTSGNFKGLMQVDTISGVVSITNAHPAGSYTVTVKANGVSTATSSFILTVNNTSCSQGLFIPAPGVSVGGMARSVTIGDLNGDGKQDLLTANNSSGNISLSTGDGTGGFTGSADIGFGPGASSIAIGDFNGDGRQDFATANSSSNNISISLGAGNGSFSGPVNLASGTMPVSIATGDFNADGKQDLVTANHGSNTVSVFMGDGLGAINAITAVPVGEGPVSVVTADFNGDGKQDIITANDVTNNLTILLGNGSGGFSTSTDDSVGIAPSSITIADFNGDGKLDLAIANYGSNDISILVGGGDGTFNTITNIAVPNGPRFIASGDFNGDGKQDLAVANSIDNNISIRLGNGSGGFTGTNNMPVAPGPGSLVIGDFNADGLQDIAISGGGSNGVSIRLGSLNNILVSGNNTIIEDGNNVISLADFTDFGNVSGNLARSFLIQNTGAVSLVINTITLNGVDASSFTVGGVNLPLVIPAGGSTSFTVTFIPATAGIKTATVNILNDHCDKKNYDFAIQGMGIVLIPALGNYPATVIPTAGGNITVVPSAAPENAHNIVAYTSAAFKGLLQVDTITGMVSITNAHPAGVYNITVKVYGIAVATSSFMLTVNNTSCSQPLFGSATSIGVGNKPFSVAIADLNGDGRQDLVTANYSDNNVSVRLGDGIGNFSGAASVPVGSNPFSIAIGDFDGDGKEDIATSNYYGSSVSVRLGDGLGNFSGNTELHVGSFPTTVIASDFNADGKKDLAVSILGNNTIAVHLGDGAGNFSSVTVVPVLTGAFSITVGDFNNDGKQDIAAANYSSSEITIHLGDGAGGFTTGEVIQVGLSPYSITTGDFNADGKPDLVTANYNDDNVSVCLGDGNGNFMNVGGMPVELGPGSVAIGDFNGDGKQDIATANYAAGSISIRLGNGMGNFSGTINLPMGEAPGSIAIGDFNADGKQDIVVANNNGNNVSLRLGISNEINVQGNNIDIADADHSPNTADLTDFGIGNNVARSFSIQNKGSVDLVVNNITVTGINASLFTISGISLPLTIPAAASVSFTITFAPVNAGVKTATINIINNDCDEGLYDFGIQGTFQCPATLVSFTQLLPAYCINAAFVTITGSQSAGSVFTGDGISDHGNGVADFDPAVAGAGTHVIEYIYTNTYGCTYNFTQSVVVNPLPLVSFSGLAANYCTADSSVLLSGNHAPGGTFTGAGITDLGNGTAKFDPAVPGAGGPFTITYSYADINGCSKSSSQQVVLIDCPTTITVNMKLFLQGYYAGNEILQPVLNNQLVPLSLENEADTITVELHDPITFELVNTVQAVLLTDGAVAATFTQPEGSYYIAIRHRNSVQTWTASALDCKVVTPRYDFSISSSQAFGDNQVEVEPGVWGFYVGDLNQDEYIDAFDYSQYNDDNLAGVNGVYIATDMNGDGFVDAFDYSMYNDNNLAGVMSIHP